MIFLDANIFLEVQLNDNRSEECKDLFYKILKKDMKAVTSDFIAYTCLIQIENKSTLDKMNDFIVFLDNLPNLTIVSPSYVVLYRTFEIMRKHKLDFDDALVISVMNSLNIKELISFDKDFDNIKDIKRIEPIELISK